MGQPGPLQEIPNNWNHNLNFKDKGQHNGDLESMFGPSVGTVSNWGRPPDEKEEATREPPDKRDQIDMNSSDMDKCPQDDRLEGAGASTSSELN